MSETDTDTYALRTGDLPEIDAPDLAYQPPSPRSYRPRIGLIGAGGISASHLDAYRSAGWDVAVICNRTRERAEARAAEYFPRAAVSDDWQAVIADPEIEVVDITPHPEVRLPMIAAALAAGKHVLSQKPFVTDIADGERLADLAEARGVKLAVNQNGRWSPHMAWMREAVGQGLIGELQSCHVSIGWDHGWIEDTDFNEIDDLILYDFGVHWFDFLCSVVRRPIHSVMASATRAAGQTARPPLLGQAQVLFDGGQASLVFDGATVHGPRDITQITGTGGSLSSQGRDLGAQTVTLSNKHGIARPALAGTWFNDGFRGAMGELLQAIEDNREPLNGARGNLKSLALCFAALASAREGRPVKVGAARRRDG